MHKKNIKPIGQILTLADFDLFFLRYQNVLNQKKLKKVLLVEYQKVIETYRKEFK